MEHSFNDDRIGTNKRLRLAKWLAFSAAPVIFKTQSTNYSVPAFIVLERPMCRLKLLETPKEA